MQVNGKQILLNDVLQSMAKRLDFAPAKHLIAAQTLPTSVGWEKTIRVANQAAATHPKLQAITANLLQSFIDHALVGEKLVKYYGYSGLAKKTKATLWDDACIKAGTMTVPPSPYLDAFPVAVYEKAMLKQLEGQPPVLTDVAIGNTSITFCFCSVRAFYERVPLETSQLADHDAAAEYSELIGVRAIRRQCFDQVILDADRELIEMRVDSPDGMPSQQRADAIEDIQEAFTGLDLFGGGWTSFTDAAFNFHRLMENIYKTAGEGSVFQLGFTASTVGSSSNNGARLLRKKGQDLRKDAFHKGGAQSVKDISPYLIGVEWATQLKTAGPQLIILGSARMLYHSPITFPEIIVRNCFTQKDFGFVSSKIDQYRY